MEKITPKKFWKGAQFHLLSKFVSFVHTSNPTIEYTNIFPKNFLVFLQKKIFLYFGMNADQA